MRIFETFKPKCELLKKYVSYYYLDIAEDATYFNEYICYPHYNTTVSLYKSHIATLEGNLHDHSFVEYREQAPPLQIYYAVKGKSLKGKPKRPCS